jgi:V8-like Glu-specific endopeptidase
MNGRSRSVVVLLTLLALLVFALGAQAQDSPAANDASGQTVSKTMSEAQQQRALTMWTREAIAAAPAMEMPVDTGSPNLDLAAQAEALAPLGPAGSSLAGAQSPDAVRIARAAYPKDWANRSDAATGFGELPALEDGTAGVYTNYDVNGPAAALSALWKIYPHIWDGKLTFNTPSGSSSCSATSISGNNIVTAAHCAYDSTNNRWYSNWVFTPAYRNGSAPYGTFPASVCTILTAYVNLTGSYSIATWARHDVAVCTMGRNSANQTLNSAVGYAGRLWNSGNNKLVFNSGYPARSYTDALLTSAAQYLRACTAETFLYTTETLGSGCYYGRGISGGSWLVGYKPFVVNGQVNSVNSGLFIGQQNLYGARFNSNNIVPLCTARGC